MKKHGIPESRIVTMMYDDLAQNRLWVHYCSVECVG